MLKTQNVNIKITVDKKEFIATLNDSEPSKEFVKLLPLDITMHEHNNNEKYYNMPENISGKSINLGSVQAGDLMIWSSNTLVLFYVDSRVAYSYTNIGKITNITGLRETLGGNSVKVKYELIKE